MDLLGSILNSMDKPPGTNEKDKELLKKQKELAIKMKAREIDELNRFRKYVEERIDRFSKDKRKFISFLPMDKVYRTIVHDVTEIAGLLAMSFGQEGLDRYIVVYKKQFPPSEDELYARRNGEEWNDEKAIEYAKKRIEEKELVVLHKMKPIKVVPTSNYKDKYIHLIGEDSAAAIKTESNKTYGFVPSENKKDIRSIEQTMNDIQAKKRLKISNEKDSVQLPNNMDVIN